MRKIKPKKEEYMNAPVGKPSSQKESAPIYPTIRIDLEHLPEAKKWKVGQEYKLEMTVKMVGLSQSRFQNDAEFEIREIGTDEDDAEGESESDGKE